MNKKLLIILVFVVALAVQTISAETFQEGRIIDFKKTCTNDTDEICSASALCNLTIKYSNSTYLVQSVIMTNNNDGNFNYTIN